MPASPSEVGSSSSLPPQSVVAGNTASSPLNERSSGEGGISKAALAIWNKLSASFAADPSANWRLALSTAEELALSVCGKDLAADLQADLLGNFILLEQTLCGLKITPTDDNPDPHTFIKNKLAALKLNIVTDAEDFKKLQSLRTSSSN